MFIVHKLNDCMQFRHIVVKFQGAETRDSFYVQLIPPHVYNLFPFSPQQSLDHSTFGTRCPYVQKSMPRYAKAFLSIRMRRGVLVAIDVTTPKVPTFSVRLSGNRESGIKPKLRHVQKDYELIP